MGVSAEYASAGAAALQKGDASKARELLALAAAGPAPGAQVLLGLARACRLLSDTAGQVAALDRLLAAEPRNLPALIQRADCFAAAGDTRSASSFYLTAIRAAPPAGVPR